LIRSRLLTSFLAISMGWVIAVAQTAPTSAKPAGASSSAGQGTAVSPSPSPQPESVVAADAPVITLNGVCEVSLNGQPKSAPRAGTAPKAPAAAASSAAHPDCKTQITRAEFEKLTKIVPANIPRRQIATTYVQFITAANEGVKLGVDKDPDFSEQLAVMRLQLLAQAAERKLRTEASNVSDADIKAYYDQNPTAFEEVTLTRIFVPRSPAETAGGQTAPDSKGIADNARQQLASGGDPDKIQKTVFEQLKNTAEPPSTKFGAKRRGTMPPAHEQKIFSLKQGEVSEVVQDTVGYVIYRVDAKQEVPLDQAKEQVKQRLTQQRLDDARQKIMGASKAEYNDAYFGSEASAPRPGQPGGPPTLKPKAEATPNPAAATGTNPSPTQSANPKK